MIIERISLYNFRNYTSLRLDLEPGINVIIGKNGQGKTNLLESIHCLGLSKSFRTNTDADLIKNDERAFQVHGDFRNENTVKHKVSINFENRKKQIQVDSKRLSRHSELIGLVPVVLYHPDDHNLTAGAPGERRRWLDIVLSQSDKHYLKELQFYRKIVKQKNELLDKIKNGESQKKELEYWNHIQAEHAIQIIQKRISFLLSIRDSLQKAYKKIAGKDQTLQLRYGTQIENDTETTATHFENILNKNIDRELRTGTSTIGPHRDDVLIDIEEKEVRKHASRGEHKSVLLALKLIEHSFLMAKTGTTPIFLLDDIYSELDSDRQKNTIQEICELGQIFITSTQKMNTASTNIKKYFMIQDGTVTEEKFA